MGASPSRSDVRCGSDNSCWIPGAAILLALETERKTIVQGRRSRRGRRLLTCASVPSWDAFSHAAMA